MLDPRILNFEFYIFVFGLYCFGLAHYRGRDWIILSIRDPCILNFEFYIFVFGLYCFGLAHYRGRDWIILSIRNSNHNL